MLARAVRLAIDFHVRMAKERRPKKLPVKTRRRCAGSSLVAPLQRGEPRWGPRLTG
jgi:hypothetical protein